MGRKYISLYFNNGKSFRRNKRDVTIAFDNGDPLYEKCRSLGSSKIKETIGISSYRQLKVEANKEDRTINNYIKCKLRKRIL